MLSGFRRVGPLKRFAAPKEKGSRPVLAHLPPVCITLLSLWLLGEARCHVGNDGRGLSPCCGRPGAGPAGPLGGAAAEAPGGDGSVEPRGLGPSPAARCSGRPDCAALGVASARAAPGSVLYLTSRRICFAERKRRGLASLLFAFPGSEKGRVSGRKVSRTCTT